ncbi:MAG: hypothetical protein CMP23_02315 [Rickettsiales bacterium]|nr:hypothetical protein [Rickettsiales bacterium]
MRGMSASRLLLSSLVLFAALALPSAASAGGISVLNATGFHFGAPLTEEGGEGRWLNQGGAVGVLLGPAKSRMLGRVRVGYNAVINLDGGVRHVGVLSAGLKIELLPELENRFGLYIATDLGITPLFTDMRLYAFGDVGVGIRFNLNEPFSLFAEVCALIRYEDSFYAGPQFFLGARISLD